MLNETVNLYGSPHSVFTYKVALMLRLSEQPFHFHYVSFQKGVHRSTWFRALSRWGQVPVLEIGTQALCQSGAILEHLADGLAAFGGGDTATRGAIREWLYWDADRLSAPVHGCYGVLLRRRGLLPGSVSQTIASYHEENAHAALCTLNESLQDRVFLVEGSVSIADLACYGAVAFADLCDLDCRSLTHLLAWRNRIEGLPGFRAPFDLLAMHDANIG